MTSGGARLRSGPNPDPYSAKSERRGYSLAALPNQGFSGKIPTYPLARFMVIKQADDDVQSDDAATALFAKRERYFWKKLWRTPQAFAWSLPQFAFLEIDVALYCRQLAICETSAATASDRSLLPRYADRIGLSVAGLAALGWKIMPDQVAEKRMELESVEAPRQRRLRG